MYTIALLGQTLAVLAKRHATLRFCINTWPTYAIAQAACATLIAQYSAGAARWGYAAQPAAAFVITKIGG